MRNRWMLVSLFFVVAHAAAAQTAPLRFGVSGGLNEAHVVGSVSDISNQSGGVFSAYFVAPINPSWSVQIGGGYTMKGWKRVEPGSGDVAKVKLNYIEIPALLRYDFGALTGPGAFGYAGPGLGFKVGCNIEASSASTGLTNAATCKEVENLGGPKFSTFDLGAIIGGGLRVPVGSAQFVLSAQYEHGLSNIQESREVKNRAVTFGLGIEVPMRR